MPQVDEKDYPEYFAYLKEKGITLKKGKEDPNNLKPIQKEFAKIGVEKSLDKMLAKKDNDKFIIVSKDDYIVDGHHRWLAAKNGRQQLNVMRANVNMKELLKATNEFPKITFKSIKNVVKNMQEVRSESFLPFNEKLDPNKDDMSDYVKDFKKSKAPQFKGKSDDKRKQMAVAAYLAAKEKTESVDEDRDYKKERKNYLGTPEQMERNAARSRARRLAIKKGIAERGDGRDIHHKDNNPMNNDPKNLSSVTQKYNRSEPRKRNK